MLRLADQIQLLAGQEVVIDDWVEGPPVRPEQERKSDQAILHALATEDQRILIVDDNTAIRQFVAALFNEQLYRT